jgi:hypothetical protein
MHESRGTRFGLQEKNLACHTAQADAVLDFNPTVAMVIEGPPPEDPETEPYR